MTTEQIAELKRATAALVKVLPDEGKMKVAWDDMNECWTVRIPHDGGWYPVIDECSQGHDNARGKQVADFFLATFNARDSLIAAAERVVEYREILEVIRDLTPSDLPMAIGMAQAALAKEQRHEHD